MQGAYASRILHSDDDVRDKITLVKLINDQDPEQVEAPVWHKAANVYWDGKHILVLDGRYIKVTLYETDISNALAAFQQWRETHAGVMPKVQQPGD